MQLVNDETKKLSMIQTNTEAVETVTKETLERLEKVYGVCAPVVSDDLERIESVYLFRDAVPDCFVLYTPNGLVLCVSEAMARESEPTQKCCVVEALIDAAMYGPETVLDLRKLQRAE